MGLPVFVYGTLRKGFHNHRLIEDIGFEKMVKATIQARIHNYGPFPYVRLEGEGTVYGELYYLKGDPERAMQRLDGLEGYYGDDDPNCLYYRKQVMARTDQGEVECWVYEGGTSHFDDNECAVIESGDWAKREGKAKVGGQGA